VWGGNTHTWIEVLSVLLSKRSVNQLFCTYNSSPGNQQRPHNGTYEWTTWHFN